jgi:signal transduction histidine kinase/DNA-binding LacI/PurR family transcriptional regulator
MFLGGLQLEWQGVVDMAREQGVNLICFHGGSLHSAQEFESQANVLYDLVSTECLDGLVIWSSNVGLYLTQEGIAEFLARYRPLPIVSCQYAVPGVPSVLQFDSQGTREAMIHLIKVHGCRRIAFLRGPETHFGAQERYHAYIDTLLEQGLPLNPNLVSPPVEWAEGSMAITSLLDERKLQPTVDFDAIVAPSDSIMLTAMTTLQARGIHIPGQVAVIGFDDSVEAGMAMPALTSVVTPFYELGRQAVLLLLAQLRGERIPDRTYLSSTLVVRQSCGCVPQLLNQATAGQVTPVGESSETVVAERRESILAEMQRAVGNPEPPRAWTELLLDGFVAEMTGQASHNFLHELSEVLRQVMDSDGDIIAWDNALSALRGQALAFLPHELHTHAEDLLHQARIVISEAAARVSARRTYRTQQYAQNLRNMGAALITTFDMDELMNLLAKGLPHLGMPSCYLAVYEDPQKPTEWTRLRLAYDEHGRIPINPNRQRFPSRRLIPEYLLPQNRRFSFTVEPLYFRENQLGYVVFEIGLVEPSVYEVLRTQISSALQGAILVQSLQQQSAQLEAANKELDAFAYSVSHDLRAPLRHVDAFIEMLKRRAQTSLDVQSQHYMDVIAESAKKMGILIDDLLSFSRMGRNEMITAQVNLEELVRDVIQECKHEAGDREIEWKIAPLPSIVGDWAMLRVALVNLISNALKFTRPREITKIEIGCERKEGAEIVIFVRDNGVGFDMAYVDKLFGVFQRLHQTDEFEGTGIGLANVRRVINRHGGRVWAEGEVDRGATFYFSLPQSAQGG